MKWPFAERPLCCTFADKQLAAAKAAWQSGDNSRKTGILPHKILLMQDNTILGATINIFMQNILVRMASNIYNSHSFTWGLIFA